MAFLWILLYCIWIAPLKIGVAVRWQSENPVEIRFGAMVWGFRIRRLFYWPGRMLLADTLENSAEGPQKEILSFIPREKKKRSIIHILRVALMSDHARRYLLRSIEDAQVHLDARIALADAAVCALISGSLNMLLGMIGAKKGWQLRVSPVFQGESQAKGACIVRLRLGNLLIAGLLGAAAYMLVKRKHKEENAWNDIPLKT